MAQRDLPDAPGTGWRGDPPRHGVVGGDGVSRGAGRRGADAFGPTGGRLLQAAAFGLTHIPDARGTGEPVAGTVRSPAWRDGCSALAERSGSVLAPMLAHLAINEAGALAALAVQRRRPRTPVS